MHLQAADAYFKSHGEFVNLRLKFSREWAAGSDVKLQIDCNAHARTCQPIPCVFVFDRDTEVYKKVVGESSSNRSFPNGVSAVALVPPDWREESICVEMLYTKDDLVRRDEHGRRLYLNEEFHERTGHHVSEAVHIPKPGRGPLVREEVYTLDGDAASIGLTKMNFASAVLSGKGAFEGINFDGFRGTFDALQSAAIDAAHTAGIEVV